MIPQERVPEHLAEPNSKVPVPQTMNENEVAKVIPQERDSELLREHTADEPVPQIMEETDDVMLDGSEVVQVFAHVRATESVETR